MIDAATTRDTSRDVRLVVADVDGTLVTPDKVVTPRARAAVQALADAGIAFTITSGRPPRGMRMLIEELRLRGPIAAFNGGLLVRTDLSVIRKHVMPSAIVPSVIEMLSKGGLEVWIYTDTEWRVTRRHGLHVDREEWTVKFSPKVVGALSELLGIPTRHIATIGDMPTDVLMFERSGRSIAMANASADVQRAATVVTSSNANEGFARAMERCVLRAPAIWRS